MGRLETYHRKRHFDRTPEPRGQEHAPTKAGGSFVIQKHDARRLHYDFRLELDGVLKSWAVPKGPSLDPAEKRLAVHTEDHPLEYGGFEGVIPEGEYGGGTVLLWDRGRWTPQDDPRAGYRRGRLSFDLDGERLQGRWHLVRSSSSRRGSKPGKEEWLLIKGKDEHARPGRGSVLVDEATTSVESGLDLGRIAALRSRVWSSADGGAPEQARAGRAGLTPSRPPDAPSSREAGERLRRTHHTDGELEGPPRFDPADVQGARRTRTPGSLEPALARLVDRPPEGDAWLHELKLDGYRLLAHLEAGDVRLLTRAGKDWTARFPEVVAGLRALPAEEAVVDGEVAVVLPDGRTSFQALQRALSSEPGRQRGELVFYGFDLLRLDGWDLRGAPLVERKRALRALLERAPRVVRLSEHVVGRGAAFLAQACALGAEGVVSKRADAPYRPGRRGDWLKVKCLARQELVIGGFTEPAGARAGLGALVVGYHDPDGRLRYAGRVGTGFTAGTLRALRARLRPLERARSPFSTPVPRTRTKAHWVEPRLVAEVSFTEWTDEGLLRHPSFQGLRDDKDPRDVVREGPAAPEPAAPERPPVTTTGRVRRRGSVVEVAGVTISSPEKVLYPELQVTKEELATYYAAIADWVLPRLGRRPLTLVRCPGGCGKKCFYQKHGNKTIHPDVPRIPITEAEDEEPYVYVETLEQLTRLVQLNVLEFHVWGSVVADIHRADTLVFDLDPDEGLPFSRVAEAAHEVRARLAELGLPSFCKTTGGKGLHVVAPIQPTLGWDDIKQFTKALSEEFARRHPERYTSKITKVSRRGRVFIDYLRNQFDATAIGAYSARARPGATVSVPVRWDEVTGSLDPSTYTVRSVPHRLAHLAADPWADFDASRTAVTDAMKDAVGFGDTKLPRPRARGRGRAP